MLLVFDTFQKVPNSKQKVPNISKTWTLKPWSMKQLIAVNVFKTKHQKNLTKISLRQKEFTSSKL
jgi:hypothetical protein